MNLHHIILSSPWETLYIKQWLLLVLNFKIQSPFSQVVTSQLIRLDSFKRKVFSYLVYPLKEDVLFSNFQENMLTVWPVYQTRNN